MDLPVDRVLAWRMGRQFLGRPPGKTAAAIAARLCGIQAQVASCAELAVAVRQDAPRPGTIAQALHEDRKLVKTWAMRGTLHLLAADEAPAYLSLLSAARTWERGSWQRTFATAKQMAAITDAASEALAGAVLTREQLTAEIVRRTRDSSIADKLASGWGALLKPVAWQGHLINGPGEGNRVTFTHPRTWVPRWQGLPEPDEAARLVIPAYLGAFGPAPIEVFDQWLTRNGSRKAALKAWFAALASDGEIAAVTVDGEPCYARSGDIEEIAATDPSTDVRLLPAFDQYVLGPGTKSTLIIDPARRGEISRAAGWISPVVIAGGRIAGTWQAPGSVLDVALFPEAGTVPPTALQAEADHLALHAGTPLTVITRQV
jgi:hypothetical protein